jgi:hypothetical protein
MKQLVGLPCTLCQQRIDSIIEGRFCEGCGRPVHDACIRPAAAAPGGCPSCGAAPHPPAGEGQPVGGRPAHPGARATEPITEQEVRAFVGRKADHYFQRWGPALKSQRARYDQVAVAGLLLRLPKTGFNWAAFLLSGLWLPYRKMYVPTLVLFGVILAEAVLEEVVFVGALHMPAPPAALGRLVGVAVAVVCGCFGNRWYLSHARKVITEVRFQGLPEEEHLRMLSKRGGTSLPAALGFFVAFIGAVFAVRSVLDLLFAQE